MKLTALAIAGAFAMAAAPRAFAAPAPTPVTATPATSAPAAPVSADAIDAFITGVMARMHVPGVALAVVRAGKVEKLATYGVANLEWQAPVTAETSFQIASTTKIFTATLVMLLVQEGKLSLEAPVSRYLPDAPPAWREVTIAHLASHTSGIPNLFDPELASVADAYAKLLDKPLAYPVGQKASYVGGDFIVLTHALEKITGQSFPALLEARLVKPLQLTCTTFEEASERGVLRTAKVIPRRASVYRWEGGKQLLQWFLYPSYTYSQGGAFSCLADLVKWAVAMDQGTFLSPAHQARAAAPPKLPDGKDGEFGVAYSLGSHRGSKRHGHSGGPALADVQRWPEHKLTVIALTNQQQLNPVLTGSVASLLLPAAPARDVAIRDARPQWTRRLRAVVAALPTGAFDEQGFSPAARQELGKALREWGPMIAGAWAPLDRWVLVEEKTEKPAAAIAGKPIVKPSQDSSPLSGATTITRFYRAHHGAIAVRWRFTLDEQGLLIDLNAWPD
jgi:CubicO group peptidase (beta-lactamase class C family)